MADRPLDLNRISSFVRVVADGSFTKAARALGVPKSSVSRNVAHLEQDLGVRLLHRTTRTLRLTDAGASFYERVAHALGEIEGATAAASDLHSDLRGVVRITAPGDFGVAVLGGLVARFVRENPAISVDLVLTGRMVDLVAEGIDLAVRIGRLRDSSLVARRVGELGSSLYASRAYLSRRGAPGSLDDLASHPCVVFRPTLGRVTWKLRSVDGQVRELSVTGPVSADDLAFVKRATVAGAGIALLPNFLCARALEGGKLVPVLPEWSSRGGVLHVAYPSARFVPQRVAVFRDYLLSELGQLCSPRANPGR